MEFESVCLDPKTDVMEIGKEYTHIFQLIQQFHFTKIYIPPPTDKQEL